jgi:predicted glycosyltransferase
MYDKNTTDKIWVDIITPSDVHFFNSILKDFEKTNLYITIRKKAETIDLANHYQISYNIIGRDYPFKYLKYIGIIPRSADLLIKLPKFNISFCFQNGMCSLVSKIRRKKNIMFDDNDFRVSKKSISLTMFVAAQKISDYFIIPEVCYDNFKKIFPTEKLITYKGYKEDVYIALYQPDKNFLSQIPFNKYIVLRPEALDAAYVSAKSIIPDLIKALTKENLNIVLIPRENKSFYIDKYRKNSNIFIPNRGLNGLDLNYYADAVLTGSGTLTREAACLGKTAVSFFPSKILLAVDQSMVDQGKILHSRDSNEIVNYILSKPNKNIKLNLKRCKQVREEVINIIEDLLVVDE